MYTEIKQKLMKELEIGYNNNTGLMISVEVMVWQKKAKILNGKSLGEMSI